MLCSNCGALIIEAAVNCPLCRAKIEGQKRHPALEILLVEDDEEIQLLLRRWLEMANLKVTGVSNGIDALEEFKNKRFDLALIDIDIPFISGIEVSRTIKNSDPHLPVLLCTAYVKSIPQTVVESSNADGLITKPIDLDQLLITIQRLTFGGVEAVE